MMNSEIIELEITGSAQSYRFDTFTETFGTVISKTPTYNGIYSIISGVRKRTLTLRGKLTREQLSDYEGIKAFTGLKKNISIDGNSYSDMAVENVKAEFEGSALMGDITVVLTEVG